MILMLHLEIPSFQILIVSHQLCVYFLNLQHHGSSRWGGELLRTTGPKNGSINSCVNSSLKTILEAEISSIWTVFLNHHDVPKIVLAVLVTGVTVVTGSSNWKDNPQEKELLLSLWGCSTLGGGGQEGAS